MRVSRLVLVPTAAIAALMSVAVLADTPPTFTADPAIAAMSADQKVDARQKAMKEDGETLKDNFKATGQTAVTAVNTVEQNFTNFPALFADGATNGKSKALPIIWTEYDKFTALFDKGKTDLEAMRTAALAGDAAGYSKAIRALSAVCSECHKTYRASSDG
jgi:cytochrome c556